MATPHTHADHNHHHGPGCGHTGIKHDGHTDYLHDGHLQLVARARDLISEHTEQVRGLVRTLIDRAGGAL